MWLLVFPYGCAPDDECANPGWADRDGDGFGIHEQQCNGVGSYTDCDDADPLVHPDGQELPGDLVDSDCDGRDLCWVDVDRDGWGNDRTVTGDLGCTSLGTSPRRGDCDDGSALLSPGVSDTPCNGIDDDCDPETPDEPDADGDGFGACHDCDDLDSLVTGEPQECSDRDSDCDGIVPTFDRAVPRDYPTLQIALDEAPNGATICLDPGTYVGTADFRGEDHVVFGAAGSAWTILDGGGAGPVVTIAGQQTPATELRGLTITGGVASSGAGVYVDLAAPTLTDLVITGNTLVPKAGEERGYGGGLFLEDYSGSIVDLTISGNSATLATDQTVHGVGMFSDRSSLTVTGLDIRDNTVDLVGASVSGVGAALEGGRFDLRDVTIADNVASGLGAGVIYGVGLFVESVENAVVDGLVVSGNRVDVGSAGNIEGVGVNWGFGGPPTVTHFRIDDNVAIVPAFTQVEGIGLMAKSIGGTWSNFIVTGNQGVGSTRIEGAGVAVYGRPPELVNGVIRGNNGGSGPGLHLSWAVEGVAVIRNVVIDGNMGDDAGVFSEADQAPNFEWCNLYDNFPTDFAGAPPPFGANGNLSVDPSFSDVSSTPWDLHLAAGSPLIDAGDPGLSDPDGTPSDIGAYGGAGGAW